MSTGTISIHTHNKTRMWKEHLGFLNKILLSEDPAKTLKSFYNQFRLLMDWHACSSDLSLKLPLLGLVHQNKSTGSSTSC